MWRWVSVGVISVSLVSGCQVSEPPGPQTVPMVEDLSTWSSPELVQPEAQEPVDIRPAKVPAGPAEKVEDYQPGQVLQVPVALGQPLAILLEAGESIRQIVDGDRAPQDEGQTRRWQVAEGAAGSGPTQRPILFVTVSEAGLTNGVTISTSRRTYLLLCKSVTKSPVRVVRWHYPHDPVLQGPPVETTAGPLPPMDQPHRYHTGYTMTSNRTPMPSFAPRQVLDDGKKLYLIYPEVTLFETVPLVRKLGVSGPQLVNSRHYLNVLILDELAPALELRVGTGEHAEVITISRSQALKTITCPDDGPACPQWPAAARMGRRLPQ